MDSHYNLKKRCKTCNQPILNKNKTGFCNVHRDRTGKNNPFYGHTHSKESLERSKKNRSDATKKLWQNPEYRRKVIKAVSKPRRDGFKKEQSERITRWYQDNPSQRKIRSRAMKKSWVDGRIEPNINSINESKMERELRNKIIELFPNRNVRKSTIRIDERWFYPDIRIDKNIIIEFYGDYWHANPKMFKAEDIVHHNLTAKQIWDNDKKRINILKNNGFNVSIIWQKEYLNNKNKVVKQIINNL